jgi:hypothetical protein
MSFARAVRTVAGLTMVSRVLGFIRDVLTAAMLGGVLNALADGPAKERKDVKKQAVRAKA